MPWKSWPPRWKPQKRGPPLEESLASYEARDIAAKAQGRVLRAVFRDRSPEAVRTLALNVVRQGVSRSVFRIFPGPCHLVLARSDGLDLDLRPLVPVVAPLVNGRGGGGPSLVEIAGEPGADADAALARAAEAVEAILSGAALAFFRRAG